MESIVVFDEVAATIAEYKVENEKLVFDYASKEGAKQAKSHIAKLRKVKTKVSEIHKEAKAEALAFGRGLDAKKNEYNGEVDKMVTFHKEPLDVIEAEVVAKSMAVLREKEEAEAKRVADMEARERAIILAEEKIAREKDEAEEKVRREAAEVAERVIKEQQEQIAKIGEEKRIAEEITERVRMEAALKAKAEAEAEEERLADIAAEKAMEVNRTANKEHRKKIEDEIRSALIEDCLVQEDAEYVADIIIVALKENRIPHISINY